MEKKKKIKKEDPEILEINVSDLIAGKDVGPGQK
jgi:hypothetical protein